MRPALIALLWLLTAASANAANAEGRTIPYQKLYDPVAKARQVDPQGIMITSFRARTPQPGQALPSDLRLELQAGTVKQTIAVARDGAFILPIRPEWAATDAVLWVNHPKSEVGISLSFSARLPPSTSTNYGRLMECLPLMQGIAKQQAGAMSFLAPTFIGVELAYPAGNMQSAVIGSGASAKTLHSDAQGHLHLEFDASIPASTPVVLSAMPTTIEPYSK
jgi:hypothetical protein